MVMYNRANAARKRTNRYSMRDSLVKVARQ